MSNSGKNSEEENTSRRMDEGPTSVFLVGKSPTVSTILDTKEMSQRMPEKSGSELELDQYIRNARMESSQGTLDRRNPYQLSKRGPRVIPSPDVDLVHMPFIDAATTDSIKGVNPQLMDVLHNQFASIADAFKVRNGIGPLLNLRQVHNQMYQVGEAMENLNERLNGVSSEIRCVSSEIREEIRETSSSEDTRMRWVGNWNVFCLFSPVDDTGSSTKDGEKTTPEGSSGSLFPGKNTGTGSRGFVSFALDRSETGTVAGHSTGSGLKGDMSADGCGTSSALAQRATGGINSFRRDINDRRRADLVRMDLSMAIDLGRYTVRSSQRLSTLRVHRMMTVLFKTGSI